MDNLKEALGIEDTPTDRLAYLLASADSDFQLALRQERIDAGIEQQDVADRLGWPIEKVREFESYWHDPTLSECRRYALAVGVGYQHSVVPGDYEKPSRLARRSTQK